MLEKQKSKNRAAPSQSHSQHRHGPKWSAKSMPVLQHLASMLNITSGSTCLISVNFLLTSGEKSSINVYALCKSIKSFDFLLLRLIVIYSYI